jgi:flagellar motor switch protein FliN/FliY
MIPVLYWPSINTTTLASALEFNEGLYGKNLCLSRNYDAALNNRMLWAETEISNREIVLNRIHLSAIGEVMNQMIGSAVGYVQK